MYGYIYDVFLNQKPYEKEVIRIEHSLTDKGLNGHTVKLGLMNNVRHAVEDLLKRGASTIVAVGSDQLFSRLADEVDLLGNRAIGLIPLGSHQLLAGLFGIPEGAQACKTLSARMLCEVPLAKVNSSYFIHSIVIDNPLVKIRCHNQFVAGAMSEQAVISILNRPSCELKKEERALHVVITPASEKKMFRRSEPLPPTMIASPKLEILSPSGVPMVVDGQKTVNTPASIEISGKTLKIIMGKERQLTQ